MRTKMDKDTTVNEAPRCCASCGRRAECNPRVGTYALNELGTDCERYVSELAETGPAVD